MELQELFPKWTETQIAFFKRHRSAMVTIADFMRGSDDPWENLYNIEKMLLRFVGPFREDY